MSILGQSQVTEEMVYKTQEEQQQRQSRKRRGSPVPWPWRRRSADGKNKRTSICFSPGRPSRSLSEIWAQEQVSASGSINDRTTAHNDNCRISKVI